VGRVAVIVAVVLLVLVVVAQFALPPLAERRVEDRLTEGGGAAEVSIDALPAALLLFGDGDEIEVRGSGLDLDLDDDPEVLEPLDGFDRVDVTLEDFRAGPFDVAGFELSRDGSGPYSLLSSSTTTAAELAGYGADQLGLGGGALLEFFATGVDAAQRPIPIELDLEMESDDGRVRVVSGGGTVAGSPTGPLAELITSAIVVRL
jgi:hypothetical protein